MHFRVFRLFLEGGNHHWKRHIKSLYVHIYSISLPVTAARINFFPPHSFTANTNFVKTLAHPCFFQGFGWGLIFGVNSCLGVGNSLMVTSHSLSPRAPTQADRVQDNTRKLRKWKYVFLISEPLESRLTSWQHPLWDENKWCQSSRAQLKRAVESCRHFTQQKNYYNNKVGWWCYWKLTPEDPSKILWLLIGPLHLQGKKCPYHKAPPFTESFGKPQR